MTQQELLDKISKLLYDYEDELGNNEIVGCQVDFITLEKSFSYDGEKMVEVDFDP